MPGRHRAGPLTDLREEHTATKEADMARWPYSDDDLRAMYAEVPAAERAPILKR
jgi:hypothetical protein